MYTQEEKVSVNIFNVTTRQLDANGNVIVASKGQDEPKTFYVKGGKVFFDNAVVKEYQIDRNTMNITSQFPCYAYTYLQTFSLSPQDSIRVRKFLEYYFSQNSGGC